MTCVLHSYVGHFNFTQVMTAMTDVFRNLCSVTHTYRNDGEAMGELTNAFARAGVSHFMSFVSRFTLTPVGAALIDAVSILIAVIVIRVPTLINI